MNSLEQFLIYFAISVFSGFVGSLTGLGGATFLIPIYTFLGVPYVYAAGASLISTIATSSGAASAYVKDRITNINIGISLETATTTGSIVGSMLTILIYKRDLESLLYMLFGIVLLSSIPLQRITKSKTKLVPDKLTRLLNLEGSYFDESENREINYFASRWWLGEILMLIAGLISGLLGIGSGAFKVLALDWGMGLPIKVSTSTSNFMIGVTAATGSSIYWLEGYIQIYLASATALGVLLGAFFGSRIMNKIRDVRINYLFNAILILLSAEMIFKGINLW
jgi:uncharacterized membrane protein YfcA